MTPRRRRLLLALAVLLAALAPAYWWLLLERGAPHGTFALDLAEARRLADSLPGEKATQVRFERVTTFRFPEVAVLAGAGWGRTEMPVYAWQLVFPARTVLVDTALDEAAARAGSGEDFDAQAYARVQAGLAAASLVVVTHEHFDHLGGLATSAHLAQVLPVAALTREQQAHPEKLLPAAFPQGALEAHPALDYQRAVAVAPGVVLIKSPGHTPGSQLVYVQRADGKEYLFLGDVAWHQENVDQVRPRPRLVTQFFLGEDRPAVLRELAALHQLAIAEPGVALVPGHDGQAVRRLTEAGLVTAGFR